MLYPYNEYLLRYVAKETTAQYLREAEVAHLLSEIKPRRQNRVTSRARQILCQVSHGIIVLGQRLNRLERPSAS